MQNKAVKLSIAATALSGLLVVVLLFLAPRLIKIYADFRMIRLDGRRAILIAFYNSAGPALAALYCLFRLLLNILHNRAFLPQNSAWMSVVSWCCAIVALVTGVCAVWYMPLLFVTLSMAFLFLIVRVVRNCFIAATELKEENSLTI